MARTSVATMGRAVLGAALVVSALAGVHWYAGIPARSAGTALERFSLATLVPGLAVGSVLVEPFTGPLEPLGRTGEQLARTASGAFSYRPPVRAIALAALGNVLLAYPLFHLALGWVEHRRRAAEARRAAA